MTRPEWYHSDPAKLAMRRLVRLLDGIALRIPESSSLLTDAENPAWRQQFLQTRLHKRPYEWLLGAYGLLFRGRSTLVTTRPWETLLVLDACRWDAFRHVFSEVGYEKAHALGSIISPATNTLDWVRRNFVINPRREELRDVTVVSSNPFLSRGYFEMEGWAFPFASCVDLWRDEWDEALDTVRPEVVVDAALREARVGTRLLVHFLQPHEPYLQHPDIRETFLRLDRDELDLDQALEAYEANLRLGLQHALRLADLLDGRVVITSDHGELFGEYGLFGHPPSVYVPELTCVPWLEIPSPVQAQGGGPP